MFLAQRLSRSASTLTFSRRLFSTSAVQFNTLYTQEHEWARVSGKSAQVGISNYAQDKLGEIIHVEFKVSVWNFTIFLWRKFFHLCFSKVMLSKRVILLQKLNL